MRNIDVAAGMARFMLDQARQTFDELGTAPHSLALAGSRGDVVATCTLNGNPAADLAWLTLALAKPVDVHVMAWVLEAWIAEGDGSPVAHGDLERREAEGDASVRTCLAATGVDLASGESHTMWSVLERGDDGATAWRPAELVVEVSPLTEALVAQAKETPVTQTGQAIEATDDEWRTLACDVLEGLDKADAGGGLLYGPGMWAEVARRHTTR